jgi:Kef-type K+ transport system membrane component KefB
VRRAAVIAIAVAVLFPVPALAADPAHFDLLPTLGGLVVVMLAAMLGGALFLRFRQPAVLGELLAGVLLGNSHLLGVDWIERVRDLPSLEVLAQVGVLFLLFQVGLETSIGQMMAVGASATMVAVLGVIAPMVLGYFCSSAFFPGHHPLSHWFVGATLCATSVGITARVLSELKRASTAEGRIILGAAVIDDVLGLVVLAVVSGIIAASNAGQPFDVRTGLWILAKAVVFLAVALGLGRWLAGRVFRVAHRLSGHGLLLTLALGLCFGFAWASGAIGLAPIVGAFAAGLVLEEVHYKELRERDARKRDVHELIEPLASFMVPIFFVLMGMRVDLSAFAKPDVLGFAAVLTLVAIAGKQVCGLGVFEKSVDRIAVGLGMIPRGEVGLIFAGIGVTLALGGERVISDAVYSAVVLMVAVTTIVTPPLLGWRLRHTRS